MNRPEPAIPWKTRLFILACICSSGPLVAQTNIRLPPGELKKLSVEELMNVEVTTVSKIPEKLTEVASAIQVVTGEDVRRSGATRLPEALRLAPNLQVAQSNAHDWAVTARGFNGAPLSNNTLADKLLVMMDGRSIYTPMFAGVFWDVQNLLLEDLDRVEVVSGPGGSLWGANAVNGVINIITKNARETQGLYATAATGSRLQDLVGLRYGAHVDSNLFFRVYGQRLDQQATRLEGSEGKDGWGITQGGFRMDYLPGARNTFTLQGDLYDGRENTPTETEVNGQNVLGRWSHNFSPRSDLSLQVYYDRIWRNLPLADFSNEVNTYDLDLQHHFPLGTRNSLLWGAGYRVIEDRNHNSLGLSFTPASRQLQLFNGFMQDQIELVPRRLVLTLGTKLLHNDFTGFEWQPSGRLAWTPNQQHTLWTAVSRAVRTPARFDADESTPYITTKDRRFNAEKVIAYELGYRLRPLEKMSVSIAAYYNDYDDLRSINYNLEAPPALVFANDYSARSWGLEVSGQLLAAYWWRLRGGFTYLDKEFSTKSTTIFPYSDIFEGIDPNNQLLLQSIMDLPKNFQLDFVGRYVDLLPACVPITTTVPAYLAFDLRLAWNFSAFTFSVVGQNLGQKVHREFGSREIPGSLYVKTTCHF